MFSVLTWIDFYVIKTFTFTYYMPLVFQYPLRTSENWKIFSDILENLRFSDAFFMLDWLIHSPPSSGQDILRIENMSQKCLNASLHCLKHFNSILLLGVYVWQNIEKKKKNA